MKDLIRHLKFSQICLFTLLFPLGILTSCVQTESSALYSPNSYHEAVAVIGGQVAASQDVFAQSTMLIETESGELCSGTLIAANLLLTAAHCIVNAESDVFHVSGNFAGRTFTTMSVASRTHPDYKRHSVFFGLGGHSNSNDIGLLLLRDKFPAEFQPALLPVKELNYKNHEVMIAGYGFSAGLRKGDFGLLYFGSTQVSSEQPNDSIILNQGGSALTCPGDSGGPVYTFLENKLVVIGVHSWGNCARGIANSESVGQHLFWLKQTIKEFNSYPAE